MKALVRFGVREDLALLDVERSKGDREEARARAQDFVIANSDAFNPLVMLTLPMVEALRDEYAAHMNEMGAASQRIGCDLYLLAVEG